MQITTSVLVGFGMVLGMSTQLAQAAQFNVDPNASVVYLRTSCTEGADPVETVNNCFDSATDLRSWITATRIPSAAQPLLVEIGPGDYASLSLSCNGGGYTTFSGAGRNATKIAGSSFNQCTHLTFKHLTFASGRGLGSAVLWQSDSVYGESSWNDVELLGSLYGWYEQTSGSLCSDAVMGNSGKHYWSNSRIVADGSATAFASFGYRDGCGSENWFLGTELVAKTHVNQTPYEVIALVQDGLGDSHFYGSVIRTLSNKTVQANYGVWCEGQQTRPLISAVCARGSVHIHGTGIDVLSSVPGNEIAALIASNNATIHANGAAYNLDPGNGGSSTRLLNRGGHIHAPYLWEEHETPPDIASVDGADMAVVTRPGGTPGMVVYSTACTSQWFDVSSNACRP